MHDISSSNKIHDGIGKKWILDLAAYKPTNKEIHTLSAFRIALLAIVSLSFIIHCGSPIICEPGKSEYCACPGGLQGAQTCANDGKSWLACQCPSNEKTAPDIENPQESLTEVAPIDGGEKTPEVTKEKRIETTTRDNLEKQIADKTITDKALPDNTKENTSELTPDNTKSDKSITDNFQPEPTKEFLPEPIMENGTDQAPCQYKTGPIVQLQPGTRTQAAGSLVWNGTEYAIAFIDQKSGMHQVYFLRFSKTGQPIGQAVLVAKSTNHQMIVRMIWTGSEYLLGWLELVPRTGGGNTTSLTIKRVSSLGIPQGNPVSIVSGNPVLHSLAWSGTTYGVTWIANNVVYLMVLNPTLTNKSTAISITLASGLPNNYSPRYAVTGANKGFAFVYYGVGIGTVKIKWMWVKADGTKATPKDIATGAAIWHFGLRWTGSGYGVTWAENYPSSGSHYLRYLYINSSGNPATTKSYKLHTEPSKPDIRYPSLHWSGTQFISIFLLASNFDDYIMYNQFSSSLQKDLTATRTSPKQRRGIGPLYSAWNGKETGVVWADETKTVPQVFFAQIDCQ